MEVHVNSQTGLQNQGGKILTDARTHTKKRKANRPRFDNTVHQSQEYPGILGNSQEFVEIYKDRWKLGNRRNLKIPGNC